MPIWVLKPWTLTLRWTNVLTRAALGNKETSRRDRRDNVLGVERLAIERNTS
jgi:hypothetical protein